MECNGPWHLHHRGEELFAVVLSDKITPDTYYLCAGCVEYVQRHADWYHPQFIDWPAEAERQHPGILQKIVNVLSGQ